MNNNNRGEENGVRYLLIGGAPKSATTSLFRYLSDHPQVCPANRKETYFFAREFDYKQICKFDETLESFKKYFPRRDPSFRLRVEATPYTLYSKGAAQRINEILPNAKIIFILRNPVKRLISDYRMHVQREHPSSRATINEFVQNQLRINSGVPNLIELGCYIRYLHPFFNTLGRENVLILFFEELLSSPLTDMQKICMATGIDDAYYLGYNFQKHNPTINVRSEYLNRLSRRMEVIAARIRELSVRNPIAYKIVNNILFAGKSSFLSLSGRRSTKRIPIPNDLINYLSRYYHPCNQELSEELGRSLPWSTSITGS